MSRDRAAFDGAKAAVFVGQRLLVYLRDDRPDIPWPGHWDFPGGGREGGETPEQTLRREVDEEFGLTLPDTALRWKRRFASPLRSGAQVWFFVVSLPETAQQQVVFGDEGQIWRLMTWPDVIAQPRIVPHFAPRLALWEQETGGISSL